MTTRSIFFACCLLAGCDCAAPPGGGSDASVPTDAGRDSGGDDAGEPDAGPVVECGAEETVRLDDGSGHANTPGLAVDGVGAATVVWDQADGTLLSSPTSIVARRREPGSPWGDATVVADGRYGQPSANASGEVLVTYYDPAAAAPTSRSFLPDSGWQDPVPIKNAVIESPFVMGAIDASGDAVSLWAEFTDGVVSTWVATRAAGADWEPMMIGGAGDTMPSGLAASDESVLVAWSDADAAEWTSSWSPELGWQEPRLAIPPPWGFSLEFGLDAVGDGAAIYLVDVAVSVADYDAASGWSVAEPLIDVAPSLIDLRLDVARDGTAVAAIGIDDRLVGAGRGPGGSWSGPSELAIDGHGVAAADDGGRGAVVWAAPGVGAWSLWMSRFADGAFGAPCRLVETVDVPARIAARPAADAILVTWQEEEAADSSRAGVFATSVPR